MFASASLIYLGRLMAAINELRYCSCSQMTESSPSPATGDWRADEHAVNELDKADMQAKEN